MKIKISPKAIEASRQIAIRSGVAVMQAAIPDANGDIWWDVSDEMILLSMINHPELDINEAVSREMIAANESGFKVSEAEMVKQHKMLTIKISAATYELFIAHSEALGVPHKPNPDDIPDESGLYDMGVPEPVLERLHKVFGPGTDAEVIHKSLEQNLALRMADVTKN